MDKGLPLKEFKRITGLPDSVLVRLLLENRIPLEISSKDGLLLHPNKGTIRAIEEALCADAPFRSEELLEELSERAGSIISSQIEEIVREIKAQVVLPSNNKR